MKKAKIDKAQHCALAIMEQEFKLVPGRGTTAFMPRVERIAKIIRGFFDAKGSRALALALMLCFAGGAARAQEPIEASRIRTHEIQVTSTALPPAAAPGTTVVGQGGHATYFYWVVAKFIQGNASPSPAGAAYFAPDVLSGSNYVQVTWNPVPGATGYDLLRTTTASLPSSGAIAISLNQSGVSFNDQGAAPSSYTLNTYAADQLSMDMTASGIAGFKDFGGQVFNVESYGASGNQAIDSSVGIASALAAAKAVHGTLFFPAGTYLTNSPLNFTSLAGVAFEGPETPAAGAGGGAGATIVYTGPALSGTCPFEFTNSSYIHISGLAFASNNPVACMALFGSAAAESFHLDLHNVYFKSGATVATVADFGAENLQFSGPLTDIVYGAAGNAGVLISSDGGAGYGISSNFGYSFGPTSTTGYSFGPNITFDGYGSAHALELDGRGDGIAFISSRGTFFQINQTGTGATAIYARGLVRDATFEAPRCESDVGSNPSYFFQAATGANIENFDLERINQSGGCGIALYAPSGAAATISGMTLSGDAPAVSWNGNIYGLRLQSYSSLSVQVSGSLVQGSLDSFTGHGSDAVAAGALNMSINGWANVVEYAQLGSGAASFTLPAAGFQSNLYKASYNSAGCSFIWSEGFGAGAGSYGTISAVTSAVGYSGAQALSCPTAGSYSSAQSVTATYTNTGGLFVVQQF